MRWLLALMVVLLQVHTPAMAQGMVPQMADCHAMSPDMGRDMGRAGGHEMPGKAAPAMHLCPGCSIPGVAPLLVPQMTMLVAAPRVAPFAALLSRSDPPSTPPPRIA